MNASVDAGLSAARFLSSYTSTHTREPTAIESALAVAALCTPQHSNSITSHTTAATPAHAPLHAPRVALLDAVLVEFRLLGLANGLQLLLSPLLKLRVALLLLTELHHALVVLQLQLRRQREGQSRHSALQ